MKKILIVGASELQTPAIIRAKELGFYVAVLDYNPNAIGIKYADEYFNVSTTDVDGVVKVAKKLNPDGVMTLGTDMPVRSVAAATSALHLPGISLETAIKSTDKGEMIKEFKKHGIDIPWFYIVNNRNDLENLKDKLVYPCIIKPTDNSGSRGVFLVSGKETLMESYFYSKSMSRSGVVIIEEYMKGKEVSVEIMTIDGQPHVLAVTDKITTGAPYFVEMGHSQKSQLPKEDLKKIKELSTRAVKALGIKCGPAHVEIILTSNGPKIIELGARLGGDYITTHLVPLSTGIDMVEATIKVLTGEKPDIKPKIDKGSAIRYFKVPPGKIISITGIDEARKIKGVKQITMLKTQGEIVNVVKNSLDRVGFVIAQGDNAKEALEICEQAISYINISVDKI